MSEQEDEWADGYAHGWADARDAAGSFADRIRAEAWQSGHDAACNMGEVCSAHQPPAALRVAAGTPTHHTTEEDTP